MSGHVKVNSDPLDISQTITIAQGQSESGAIDLVNRMAIGFGVPHALEATTAQLSFKSSDTIGGTYLPVYKNGVKVTLPIAIDIWNRLNEITDLFHVRFLKIVAETAAGAPVAQATAQRIFTVIKL